MHLTILDSGRTATVDSVDGSAIAAADLEPTTGWLLKTEGLCQGDVCVPVRDRAAVVRDDFIDLQGFAAALQRPIVIDEVAGVAAIGERREIAQQLRDRQAPDFTLDDLNGVAHTMSAIGRKKKVLVVWASW